MAQVLDVLHSADLHDEARRAAWRLWELAEGNSGGGKVAADVLLGSYNGHNFPFDLSQLMRLDQSYFSDAMTVFLYCWKSRGYSIRDHMGLTADDFMRMAKAWGRLPKGLEDEY